MRKIPSALAILPCLAACLLPACASSPAAKHEAAVLEAEGGKATGPVSPTALSRAAASARSRQIGHVTYGLWFGLDEDQGAYQGRAVVTFDLKPKAHEHGDRILLDFEQGDIQTLSLNGAILQDSDTSNKNPSKHPNEHNSRYDGHRISFKVSELQQGPNRVEISFSHPYSKNGEGFYRFKDPEDGHVYLYSNFEPYNAHRMFPCFDQPDLKASYELTVEAPEDWIVISNTQERGVSRVNGRQSWAFPPSPLLSPYVFALVAGPYQVWKGDANGIPLRLLARQSLAKYVDAEEWLSITAKGLDYYAVQFGYPYPYSKYDQILVPDFNAGAMENAAAVTFTERYAFRSRMTANAHLGRAGTILHEMAHMWFGDLVTMRWWNGLWLNESFATFMAAQAIDQATGFAWSKESWQNFFAGEKISAYAADQLVTTHPVEVPVSDTEHALSNFDAITYGKGASSIKQLQFLIGEDEFEDGVQRYFQKFALRSTTIHDFISMLAEASGENLIAWQKEWFQSPGVNTVQAQWSCAVPTPPHPSPSGNENARPLKASQKIPRINSFKLIQGNADMSNELRRHKTRILLGKLKGNDLKLAETVTAEYKGVESSVPQAIGKECPDFVFPNYQDYDYVKVELDPTSLEELKANLGRIQDSFLREMLWSTLWERVTDAKMPAQEYARLALADLGAEHDTNILKTVTGNLETVFKILPEPLRRKLQTRFEIFYKDKLSRAAPGSDQQLVWLAAYVTALAPSRAEGIQHLRNLLDGKAKVSGVRMDPARRWNLILNLSRLGARDAPERIEAELKADPSDYGSNEAIEAYAAFPSLDGKKKWFSTILKQSGESKSWNFEQLRYAMGLFNAPGQEELSREFMQPYFDSIADISRISGEDAEYERSFVKKMFPSLCDPSVVAKASETIDRHPGLPDPVLKGLKTLKQEEERCVRARALALAQPADEGETPNR